MSTLIIGALFVIALAALVGVVFILRSEQHASRTIPTTPANSASPTATARSEAATSAPITPKVNLTLSTSDAASSPIDDGEPHLAMANGQFRELSVELHRLHGQAQEIEHRLSVLSEMIERIQRTQDAHVAEEYSSFGERQSVK